ncbi:MAG TPA: FAD-dependent oxidoreductase [Gemmatimonadaceae bacterium]|jgi:spermidine dehydrogenase|nr:FAD-dependent oxidoreductase [Gemmatimonadaceae bacterium]
MDRDLGMNRPITRRDFVNGVAVSIGGALIPSSTLDAILQQAEYAPEQDPGYYPPALMGLRGSHPGSFEIAHAARDHTIDALIDSAAPTGEHYDVVIVGGGISGLSAAHFCGSSARVLVLDNHDDFGGHAKRNEFEVAGRRLLMYGGTQSIDGPDHYSHTALTLLRGLGVDLDRFYRAYDRHFYTSRGLSQGIFFDKETFGTDHLAVGAGLKPWAEVLAGAPLPEAARADIARVYETKWRTLPHDQLARMSYRDYLLNVMHVAPEAMPYFQALTHDLYGVGIDAVPAQDVFEIGFPAKIATPPEGEEPYIFHFPDGNATIARLLVRQLIPGAIPGATMDDIVTARVNYAKLDDVAHRVRLRLNSTVVRVRQSGSHVVVTYVRGGKACSVRASGVVLACWNMIIPYVCPEMPEAQKAALAYGAKVPLVYTNVALRNWRAFASLGIDAAYAPGSYHTLVDLDYPVSLGSYAFPKGPDEPIVAHMIRTPCHPGLPARDQHRAGRAELLATTFETFERNVRDQLARLLGAADFDPARDIVGLTVNRWPHGYAYEYNTLWDSAAWPGATRPCVTARAPFGRITIANSDAGASAYTNAAIDQAHRAVRELFATI